MSANLTPQYRKAEQAYRQAATLEEELKCLLIMLVELPKHKGTDRMHADLKRKISQVRKRLDALASKENGRGTHHIARQGAGRAVIIGSPNSGKSQLLATLTQAKPIIANYPFSTTQPLPGMMPWNDVFVQLIDTPPITRDALDRETLSLVRGADLVLLLLDLGCDNGGEQLIDVVDKINQTKSRLGRVTEIDSQNIGVTFTQTLLLANKMDLDEAQDRLEFFNETVKLNFELLPVSAKARRGLPELADRVYAALNVIRIYTKMPGNKEPDMECPVTLKRGQSLLDLASQIHRDLARNLTGGRVWSYQDRDATQVKCDYLLNDQDIVELQV